MKKILMTLVLSLLVFGNVFALDLGKIEEVWEKSMDIVDSDEIRRLFNIYKRR